MVVTKQDIGNNIGGAIRKKVNIERWLPYFIPAAFLLFINKDAKTLTISNWAKDYRRSQWI